MRREQADADKATASAMSFTAISALACIRSRILRSLSSSMTHFCTIFYLSAIWTHNYAETRRKIAHRFSPPSDFARRLHATCSTLDSSTGSISMKTIGLIGGMSWESTATYYRLINEAVRRQRGGLHSAEIAMRSLDFVNVVELQKAGRWD